MKKKILAIAMVATMMFGITGCGNKDLFDTVYTYDKAIVAMTDGESVTIEIKQWKDYEDGEQFQITAKDDTVYLVNSVNCVLVRE